jgi:polyhydroxyalkanoate synthesis regulator phasin
MAEELRKILMAGFGAVATAVERTVGALSEAAKPENRERVKETVDDLSKKGEEAYEKSKALGSELFSKIGDAFSGLKEVETDEIKRRLGDLADDALDDVERAIGEIRKWRAERQAQGESPGAQPESGAQVEPGAQPEPGAQVESGAQPESGGQPEPGAQPESGGQPEPDAHPESGDKPQGAQEEFLKATGRETTREDGEDLSDGTDL